MRRGRVRWSSEIRADDGEGGSYLCLERLTGELRDRAFRLFIKRVSSVATDVLASIAERLQSADANTRADVLDGFLARRSLDEVASVLACKKAPLEFFPSRIHATGDRGAAGEVWTPSRRLHGRGEWTVPVSPVWLAADSCHLSGRP